MAGMNGGAPHATIEVTERDAGHWMAKISGELDIVSVAGLRGPVDDLLARPAQRVDLDVSGLDFMDSSGLAVLLRLADRFGPLRVFGASTMVRRVIEATGLSKILLLDGEAPPP
jgi:anti-sigma B factor antagonist